MNNQDQQATAKKQKGTAAAAKKEPGYRRGPYKKDPAKPKTTSVTASVMPEDLAVIRAKYGSLTTMIKLVAMQIRKESKLPAL
jgi:hypothetical protein